MKMKKLSPLDIIPYRYERRDVYAITYLPTGKKYVGKSRDVKERFDRHYYALRGHRHSVVEFQRDYDKYGGGREAFKVEIIDCQLPFLDDRNDPEHNQRPYGQRDHGYRIRLRQGAGQRLRRRR